MPTILVIEREPAQMRLLGWSLREAGFEVTSAPPKEAIQTARRTSPHAVVVNAALEADESRRLLEALRGLGEVPVVQVGGTPPAEEDFSEVTYLARPHRAAEVIAVLRSRLGLR